MSELKGEFTVTKSITLPFIGSIVAAIGQHLNILYINFVVAQYLLNPDCTY